MVLLEGDLVVVVEEEPCPHQHRGQVQDGSDGGLVGSVLLQWKGDQKQARKVNLQTKLDSRFNVSIKQLTAL